MYTDILAGIAGIHVFPVVSLVLFIVVFTGAMIRVARMDRAGVERLAALPLDDPDGAVTAGTEAGR